MICEKVCFVTLFASVQQKTVRQHKKHSVHPFVFGRSNCVNALQIKAIQEDSFKGAIKTF